MSGPLWQQSAVDIAAGIRGKKFSCSEVMASVVERIRAVNPKLNAIVTDLTDQDALNRVWAEYFRDAKPATTTVQVVRLATDPRCLVEINAIAVID